MQDAPVREAQSNGLIQTEVSLASTSVAWPRVNQPVAWLRLAVSNIFEGLSILLILAEVGVIGAAVFTRYVINRPIAGSDELATLVLVWLTFISGAVVSRRRAHLSVNIIVKLLPGRVQQWIEATVGWLMVAMLAVLAWQSVLLAQRRSDEVSQGFGYSLALLPLPLVLGAIGMIVFEGAHLRQLPRMPAAVSGIALAAAVLGVWEFGPRLGWDLTK
ncbi:MAG TPA: TRAP transporter small permease, partial [Chloroflexota bacterium]